MAAAIFAGIGAATGLAQGIFGASDAARQNSEAEDRYREQVKQQKEIDYYFLDQWATGTYDIRSGMVFYSRVIISYASNF